VESADRDSRDRHEGGDPAPNEMLSLWEEGRALVEEGQFDDATAKLNAAVAPAPPQVQAVVLYDLGVALEGVAESNPERATACTAAFRRSVHAALALLPQSGDTDLLMRAVNSYARTAGQWGNADVLEDAGAVLQRLAAIAPALALSPLLRLPLARLATGWFRLSMEPGAPEALTAQRECLTKRSPDGLSILATQWLTSRG